MNDVLLLIGRVLFATLFITSGMHHLTKLEGFAQYAAGGGVPAPKLAVVVTGVMILLGGISILLGYEPAIGAVLLAVFLIPVAIIMHRFWGLTDAAMAQMQRIHFWKNIAMAGAALMIYYFATVYPGAWPYSIGR
jgi:putative oxidoreductase